MPGGDGKGPMGAGMMKGREAGFCRRLARTGYFNPLGFNRGRGLRKMFNGPGRAGFNRFGYPSYDEEGEVLYNEKEYLKNQKDFLEAQIHILEKRLSSLNEADE